jgi:dUTP pyrophosphatase
MEQLKIKYLSEHATCPVRATEKSAGYDLFSAYDYEILPNSHGIVKTDISIQMPTNCYGRVAPRSGLSVKFGVQTGAGVIDADYTGNIGVVLFNHGTANFVIKRGDRIAQLILECIKTPEVVVVREIHETARGEGGFGSTGN